MNVYRFEVVCNVSIILFVDWSTCRLDSIVTFWRLVKTIVKYWTILRDTSELKTRWILVSFDTRNFYDLPSRFKDRNLHKIYIFLCYDQILSTEKRNFLAKKWVFMLKKEFSCRKLIFDTHKFSWQMYLIKTKSTFFLRGIEKKMRKALREVMEIDECQCMQKKRAKIVEYDRSCNKISSYMYLCS